MACLRLIGRMMTKTFLLKVLIFSLLQNTPAMSTQSLRDCKVFQYFDSHISACVDCKVTCVNFDDAECKDNCKDYSFFLEQIDAWKNATGILLQNEMILQTKTDVRLLLIVASTILVLMCVAFCMIAAWMWCPNSCGCGRNRRGCCEEKLETKVPGVGLEARLLDHQEEVLQQYINVKTVLEHNGSTTIPSSSVNPLELNSGAEKLASRALPSLPHEKRGSAPAIEDPEIGNSGINSNSGDAYAVLPARISSEGPAPIVNHTYPSSPEIASTGSTLSSIYVTENRPAAVSDEPLTSNQVHMHSGYGTYQLPELVEPVPLAIAPSVIDSHETEHNSLPRVAVPLNSVRQNLNDHNALPNSPVAHTPEASSRHLPSLYRDVSLSEHNGLHINGGENPNLYGYHRRPGDSAPASSEAYEQGPPMSGMYNDFSLYSSYADTDYFQSNPNLGEAEKEAAKHKLDSKFWDLLQSKRYIQDVALDSENRLFLLVHNDNVGEASVDVPRYIRDHWSVPQEYIIYPV